MQPDAIPTMDDIRAAAGRLAGNAAHTPLISNPVLDERTGARVFLKPESLQRTGSFKFRGAFNAISLLGEDERARGVVACSSGNHAQGVAEAARLFGAQSTIVMPSDAPRAKAQRTQRSGARIVSYARASEDRDAIAAEIVDETGAAFVHPYDNGRVMAGQGTVGLEIADDMAARELEIDRVLVCTGGGGLTAGLAMAVHDRFPEASIHSVEPAGFDDHARSLVAGERLSNQHAAGSACDALMAARPGRLTFAVNRRHLSEGLSVTDEQAFAAMRFAFAELKLVLEPGGAVSLAALLAAGRKWAGETIVCTLSGGNVDAALFARVLAAAQPQSSGEGGETIEVE